MADVFDIKEDPTTGDEIHKDGDLLIGECTEQNLKKLFIREKGSSKQYPKSGIGIGSWILDEKGINDLRSEATAEIEDDGAEILSMQGKTLEEFKVVAQYGEQEG